MAKPFKTFLIGSMPYTLLKTLGECGEISYTSLDILFYDKDKKIILNAVNKLAKDGYISIVGKEKDKVPSIRLKKPRGLDFLLSISQDLYNHYMNITSNHRFQTTNLNSSSSIDVIRKHKISEASIFFKSIGASVNIDNPKLSLSRETDILDIPIPVFYTSVELKNVDMSQRHKVEFTRLVGCFFVNQNAYMVYNIGNSLLKWNQQGEQKAKLLIQDIIRFNSKAKNWHIHAIVLGNTMDDLYNSIFSEQIVNTKHEFLSFFNVFENVFIMPLDKDGLSCASDFLIPNIHEKIKIETFGSDLVTSSKEKLDCDCDIVDGETRAFAFMTGNVARLKRFCEFAELSQSTSKFFQIYCYDYQLKFLEKVCPFNVQITPLLPLQNK